MSENRQNPTDDQPLRDAIRDRLAARGDTGAVVVGYSIVAEVVTADEDGPWLWTSSDEAATSWARIGRARALTLLAERDLAGGWQGDE